MTSLCDPGCILYESESVLALYKPSNTVVHRGWADDCPVLADSVREYLDADTAHPIHRLDRGTSGVVVFAKNAEAARRLNESFANGEVRKTYLALVRGVPKAEEGVIDHPIPRREKGPRVEARTRWVLVESRPAEPRHLSLVRAFPETGRLHQVRRHLKHIDHPVIGDANYGKGKLNRAIRERYGLARLALHAEALTFPDQGADVTVYAPLPEDLREPLRAMGFDVE